MNSCIDGFTIHGLFTVSVSGCNLTWTGTTECGGIIVSFSSIIFTGCCPSFVVSSVARASYRTRKLRRKSLYCCSKSLPISISVFGRDIIRAIPFAFLFRMVMFTSIPNSGVKVCPLAKLTLGLSIRVFHWETVLRILLILLLKRHLYLLALGLYVHCTRWFLRPGCAQRCVTHG